MQLPPGSAGRSPACREAPQAPCRPSQDMTAVLDVTDPEPPAADSPLYTLPNVFLTPHIAGSSGDEVARMGTYMAEEFLRMEIGEECLYEVSAAMLATMA